MNECAFIKKLTVSAYTIPTDTPEADGTLQWGSTTLVLVEIEAGGKKGIGYTYAHMATAILIDKTLKQLVIGEDAMHIPALTEKMKRCIRNNDNCGIAMMAVSAVDTALWDLKAKILNVSLGNLIGSVKKELLVNNRYTIKKKLGEGRSKVFLCTDVENPYKEFAIKILP
ncbi:MAG TPA: hypothetical protein VLB84_10430, partial [Bacteroidia bacterium]|nr:hypothetical protein [Bacteroidia bacterium]